MRQSGGVVVYVTSHGFGHLNRSVAVINKLPASIPVTIRSSANLFAHWRERLRRPASLEPYVSDSGAVNPPGDSAATDGAATLALAQRVHAEAMGRVEAEAEQLRESRAAAVLCDAPPVPLVAARIAGVPGFVLANFTWAEIYAPHARKLGAEAIGFVSQIRASYKQATAVFRASPSLRLVEFSQDRVIDVGMVVTPGRDRKSELRRELGLVHGEKLVYFYIGRYGQGNLGWERLDALGKKGIHFVGFHPAPLGDFPNLRVVAAESWTGADLAASCDAMVAKAGYGTVCEAMVAGTPLIYPPRTGFAEHRALDQALRAWGGGIPTSAKAFGELKLDGLLERAFAMRPGPPPFPADGAARVAERLTETCESTPRARHANGY